MTDQTTKYALGATRRQFAAMSVAAAAASGIGNAASAAPLPVAERAVSGGALVAPVSGEHPGLIMFASPAASVSANAAVAQELAKQGWAVMLVPALSGDPQTINRTAKGYAAKLAAEAGVSGEADAYVLQSFSAAQPALSLASRSDREAAAQHAVLFAVPAATAKSSARRDSLSQAARTLHRLAA